MYGTIGRRDVNWLGHYMIRDGLITSVMKGIINEERGRERTRFNLIYNMKTIERPYKKRHGRMKR